MYAAWFHNNISTAVLPHPASWPHLQYSCGFACGFVMVLLASSRHDGLRAVEVQHPFVCEMSVGSDVRMRSQMIGDSSH
jgi:hypothetical protein